MTQMFFTVGPTEHTRSDLTPTVQWEEVKMFFIIVSDTNDTNISCSSLNLWESLCFVSATCLNSAETPVLIVSVHVWAAWTCHSTEVCLVVVRHGHLSQSYWNSVAEKHSGDSGLQGFKQWQVLLSSDKLPWRAAIRDKGKYIKSQIYFLLWSLALHGIWFSCCVNLNNKVKFIYSFLKCFCSQGVFPHNYCMCNTNSSLLHKVHVLRDVARVIQKQMSSS